MAKVTKSQIIEGLKAMADKFQLSVEAQSELDFTVDSYEENPRNVTKEDLQVVKTVVEAETGEKLVNFIPGLEKAEAKAEGKAKKEEKAKLPSKKEAENSVKEKPVVVPKNTNKAETVASEPKAEVKQEVKEENPSKPHNDYLAKFPETLVSKSLKGTLKIRRDLKTIQDVARAFNNEEDIIIATYWTKKLLKQFSNGYDPMGVNPNRPKSFEHDLDLTELTYANDIVITGCSLYSYVPQVLLPGDFEYDEDGMRYANGCEFELYEVVEE